ncbi:MAG: DUF1015 domain-containing protein [Lachnospiraceae bacterium]|nr:DUF1015 domain-containing protein [Lachnospiraceae bacterium]
MADFSGLGFYPADILLPKDADMTKWAVVACDQFTSQPEYWEETDRIAGDAPSTLRLILPEAKLNDPNVGEEIEKINRTMEEYAEQGVFRELPSSLIYIEREQSDGRIRHGLIGMVDLEEYDYTPGSGALIRASEGTILSRIPPRVRVREHALIELPHIMVLIDDPDRTVIEPLKDTSAMEKVYDFDLMQGGGHLAGWKLTDEQMTAVADALRAVGSEEAMQKKYGLSGVKPLLFAVGDGNHSLATAKQCYENLKKVTPEEEWKNLPARYALVEIVNNHDDALQFEAIHRVLFDVDPEKLLAEFHAFYPGTIDGEGEGHRIEYVWEGGSGVLTVPSPKMQLEVGTLQTFLDAYLKNNGGEIDYVHDPEVVRRLGSEPKNIGFLLPAMGKEQFFATIMKDGVLPRKTFSMGHAEDKRYYVDARKIR